MVVDIASYERDFKTVEKIIKKRALEAFKDDLGSGDVTTDAVFSGDNPEARAVIVAEEFLVLAGLLEAETILAEGKISSFGRKDGDKIKKGETILTIKGPLKEILARERVILNYLSRMSGIATVSNRLFKQHGKRVAFLRKTDPGLLFSEKRAVALGASLPHRLNLSDGILIKDNHLDRLSDSRIESIKLAISRAAKTKAKLSLEIEVDTEEEAELAAKELSKIQGPRMILLDNMSIEKVESCAGKIRSIDSEIIIEASGGISEEQIASYLEAGADVVSSSLFLQARPAKLKLEIIRT